MIRMILTQAQTSQKSVEIPIPPEYAGKKIEVMLFRVEEGCVAYANGRIQPIATPSSAPTVAHTPATTAPAGAYRPLVPTRAQTLAEAVGLRATSATVPVARPAAATAPVVAAATTQAGVPAPVAAATARAGVPAPHGPAASAPVADDEMSALYRSREKREARREIVGAGDVCIGVDPTIYERIMQGEEVMPAFIPKGNFLQANYMLVNGRDLYPNYHKFNEGCKIKTDVEVFLRKAFAITGGLPGYIVGVEPAEVEGRGGVYFLLRPGRLTIVDEL